MIGAATAAPNALRVKAPLLFDSDMLTMRSFPDAYRSIILARPACNVRARPMSERRDRIGKMLFHP